MQLGGNGHRLGSKGTPARCGSQKQWTKALSRLGPSFAAERAGPAVVACQPTPPAVRAVPSPYTPQVPATGRRI